MKDQSNGAAGGPPLWNLGCVFGTEGDGAGFEELDMVPEEDTELSSLGCKVRACMWEPGVSGETGRASAEGW